MLLTLRTMDGGEPDIPVYKVIESKGPTNTRVYTVAVYFKGDRLAKAEGSSIQTAEMNAAKLALDTCSHLFPHLDYQKKIVERSLKKNKDHLKESWEEEVRKKRKILGLDDINEECSRRNDKRLVEMKSQMNEQSHSMDRGRSVPRGQKQPSKHAVAAMVRNPETGNSKRPRNPAGTGNARARKPGPALGCEPPKPPKTPAAIKPE